MHVPIDADHQYLPSLDPFHRRLDFLEIRDVFQGRDVLEFVFRSGGHDDGEGRC